MSTAAETYARLTDFDQSRFCPYHGEFIALADCPIVATTEIVITHRDAFVTTPSASPGGGPLDDELLGGESDAEDARHDDSIRRTSGRVVTVNDIDPNGEAQHLFKRGNRLKSSVDGKERQIVHGPPPRPVEERRRFFGGRRHPLPVPAELAEADGGARLRPARACSRCLHPLPEAIDSHDPLLIPLVGHTMASKTTTIAAFVDQLGTHGPQAFGLDDIAPTEATSAQLNAIMRSYRAKVDLEATEADRWHRPLEFVAEVEENGRPAVVFFHDVAGEDVMAADKRLLHAPFVLWADAILFVYNPEASPKLRSREVRAPQLSSDDVEQAAVLNGLLNDLKASPRLDPSGRSHHIPPLVIAVSKADLLPNPPNLSDHRLSEEAVQAALVGLDDGAMVAAGKRWPEVHWHFIAPKPPSGSPEGILPLFSKLLSLATR